MSVPTERERAIAEAIEAAREYLYRGGMHYQGSFHAFMGNPNNGLGGMVDLAEVLALYAIDRYDAGHKAGHDEAIERAARMVETELITHDRHIALLSATPSSDGKAIAAAIRALRQADSAEGKARDVKDPA